jgi:ferritin-like metal-binding protein YciE
MSTSDQNILQYLNEARATELSLVRVLQSQIAMTPRGSYRDGLERHLGETRDHLERVETRLAELGHRGDPLTAGIGVVETVIGQALAIGKAPFDLLRGSGGEEKVLKNAKGACASEAREIATYTAIERLAQRVGDQETARLAASIRADEEQMLKRILRELPRLTDAVVGAEVEDDPSYDVTTTGAAALRGKQPWAGYDELTADEVIAVLSEGDDERTEHVRSYERAHKNRAAVLHAAAHALTNA